MFYKKLSLNLKARISKRLNVAAITPVLFNTFSKTLLCFTFFLISVFALASCLMFLYFLNRDVNNNIMELLIMAYACKTSSAKSIVGVIPYLPYSKQCEC